MTHQRFAKIRAAVSKWLQNKNVAIVSQPVADSLHPVSIDSSTGVEAQSIAGEEQLDVNTGVVAVEGGAVTIESTMLNTADANTPDSELTYTVIDGLDNGYLIVSGQEATSFSQADVDAGLVSYQHDGSESVFDQFDFSVDDGQGRMSLATFEILIDPVNDSPVDLSAGIGINIKGDDLFFAADDGNTLFADADEFTLEFSFESENAGNYNTLASFRTTMDSGDEDDAMRIGIGVDGNLDFTVNGETASADSFDYSSLFDGELNSIAVSWNCNNGSWQVHVNGVLTDAGNGLAVEQQIRSDGEFIIGQDQQQPLSFAGSDREFRGTLNDVRVWNEQRSSQELLANYAFKFDPAIMPDGLIANWQMKSLDGGTVVVDSIGSNSLRLMHIDGAEFGDPVLNLNVDESAMDGTYVGHVVPSDMEFANDLVFDGMFLNADEPTARCANNGV